LTVKYGFIEFLLSLEFVTLFKADFCG